MDVDDKMRRISDFQMMIESQDVSQKLGVYRDASPLPQELIENIQEFSGVKKFTHILIYLFK